MRPARSPGKRHRPDLQKKSLLGSADTGKALHEFLKFGKAAHSRKPDESWNEFIFQAYHHHQSDAIFLTGLPDVKGSLPHAPGGGPCT